MTPAVGQGMVRPGMDPVGVVVLVVMVGGSVGVPVGRCGRGLLGGGHDGGRGVGHGGYFHSHHGAGRVTSHTQHKMLTRQSQMISGNTHANTAAAKLCFDWFTGMDEECLQNFSLIYTVIPSVTSRL